MPILSADSENLIWDYNSATREWSIITGARFVIYGTTLSSRLAASVGCKFPEARLQETGAVLLVFLIPTIFSHCGMAQFRGLGMAGTVLFRMRACVCVSIDCLSFFFFFWQSR
jgi:hypothetical protein